jgi:hypothetical protein
MAKSPYFGPIGAFPEEPGTPILEARVPVMRSTTHGRLPILVEPGAGLPNGWSPNILVGAEPYADFFSTPRFPDPPPEWRENAAALTRAKGKPAKQIQWLNLKMATVYKVLHKAAEDVTNKGGKQPEVTAAEDKRDRFREIQDDSKTMDRFYRVLAKADSKGQLEMVGAELMWILYQIKSCERPPGHLLEALKYWESTYGS